MRFSPTAGFGLPALSVGILFISFSPVLVQVSEVGPSATAVYRMLFALPALTAWMVLEQRSEHVPLRRLKARDWGLLALAGLFFTGDLVAWHSAIRMSGVANATFLAHLSTPIVSLGAAAGARTGSAAAGAITPASAEQTVAMSRTRMNFPPGADPSFGHLPRWGLGPSV